MQYTYKPNTLYNESGFFGAVDIIIGSRIVNTRVIRFCRKDKQAALSDAGRLVASMVTLGVTCPINIGEYE